MRATPLLRNAPATASAALRERIRRPAYLSKLANPKDLAPLFKVILIFPTSLGGISSYTLRQNDDYVCAYEPHQLPCLNERYRLDGLGSLELDIPNLSRRYVSRYLPIFRL